ncbi:MAG: CARDB domain-containing protein [Capsulimonadaceae bacterium]|nr:CARDB domain-containing protein [Capsulimonadaceae bacterium]
MKKYRILLIAAIAALSAATAFAAANTPLPLPAQPTFTADSFTDFVGLNASPFERYLDSGPFKGAGTKYAPEVFFDLGVRHYRTGLKHDLTLPDQPERISNAYRKYGAQAMLLISPGKIAGPDAIVARLKLYTPGSVDLLEGPNEVNNKFPPQLLNLRYKGKTDEAAGAAFMNDVYAAVKGDPATKSICVVAYTAIFTDYHLARPHDAFDYANMHSYQGYDVPSSSLRTNEIRSNNILPVGATIKPYVPTECGYNVQADRSNGANGVGSLRAQVLNIPMLLAEYFRHGIKRAYLFALHNADGYGLLEDDQETKRPSYYALKSLLAEIKDADWDPSALKWTARPFRPKALLFSIAGAPASVHTVTLQKQSGQYELLIWNEVVNFDQNRRADVANPPVQATIQFQTPLKPDATILTQNDSGRYDAAPVRLAGGKLDIAVPSSVTIIRLTPAAPTSSTPPLPPKGLVATTTENSAHVEWKAGKDPVAGYFVFRNGDFLTATAGTSYDDTSNWIMPSLGYTYTIKAFTKAGEVSDAANVVAVTPDKRPDLVCVRMDAPAAHAGEPVTFRATVRNAGNGATPADTPIGVTFFVDGRYTSYGVTEGQPLLPGQSVEIVANSAWKATQGAHILKGLLDDVNRIPSELNKENNVVDRTLPVDVSAAGALSGSGDPAPGAANLTALGDEDWAAWGVGGKDIAIRKTNGAGKIGDLRFAGNGFVDTTSGCPVGLAWGDGVPTQTVSNLHTGLWMNGVDHAYMFDAAADATPRTLRVFVAGIEGAQGKLTAHLSDGSAPDYVSDSFNGDLAMSWAAVPGGFSTVYTIRYHAASANQKLTVTWALASEPNRFLGQIRLQAAALAMGSQ